MSCENAVASPNPMYSGRRQGPEFAKSLQKGLCHDETDIWDAPVPIGL